VNFSGAPHQNYVLGVPSAGAWKEVLNTDAEAFGGSGVINAGELLATAPGAEGLPAALTVTLPPLGASWFTPAG
jgi:1,4-alpha-glucan branching enzyme